MATNIERQGTRTRTWTFVLYPESAPENWRDLIDEQHIEWIESPLHDRDINGDGSPKKAHIHVLLIFGGVKSYDQVLEITKLLNQPIPQRVQSAKALVRYMAHLDNPDKAQYSKDLIISHGGADVTEFLRPSVSAEYAMICEMLEYIRNNGVVEFYQLMDYAALYERDTWFPLLVSMKSYAVINYIKSNRHRVKDSFDNE